MRPGEGRLGSASAAPQSHIWMPKFWGGGKGGDDGIEERGCRNWESWRRGLRFLAIAEKAISLASIQLKEERGGGGKGGGPRRWRSAASRASKARSLKPAEPDRWGSNKARQTISSRANPAFPFPTPSPLPSTDFCSLHLARKAYPRPLKSSLRIGRTQALSQIALDSANPISVLLLCRRTPPRNISSHLHRRRRC